MKDIPAKALYISKKRELSWVVPDGSLTGVPENVIDKWAFETRFVKKNKMSPPFQVGILSQVL